jgi:FkbM family methyltransferase
VAKTATGRVLPTVWRMGVPVQAGHASTLGGPGRTARGGATEPPAPLRRHPVSVRATLRALLRSRQVRRAPLRTAGRGISWLARCALRRPAVITLERWGCRLYLPAGMRLGTTAVYLFRDDYEPELRHLDRLVRSGGTFVDAGANIGLYTVVAATLVGDRGTVVAVEPSAATCALLRRNVELNGLHNVVVVQKALSDATGTARLFHVAGAPNYSLGEPPGGTSTYEDVETVTLDELVRAYELSDVSCVKIDVEGAESLVLRGAEDTLSRWHPSVILEVNDRNAARMGASQADAAALLVAQGYRFDVADGRRLVPLTGAPGLGNVVARRAV